MVEETEIESKVSEQLRATEQIVKALSPLDVDGPRQDFGCKFSRAS